MDSPVKEGTIETLTLWIVDDEPGLCLGAAKSLNEYVVTFSDLPERVGFSVTSFHTGEAFLEQVDLGVLPDILLLDHRMPGISGLEILEILSARNIKLMTIMITAYGTFEYAVQATKLGAFDFVPKPFTPRELRYSIEKAVRDLILTRKARQLETEKKKVRFEMISVVSHELKSPINAIEGYLDIMKAQRLGAGISEYAAMVDRCMVRINGMRKLIVDLMDLTRLESGQKVRHVQELDLVPIVKQSLESIGPDAAVKQLAITLDMPEAVMMTADPTELTMVCNNLLTNAVKYNIPEGSIFLTIQPTETRVMIQVRDTGIGLSDDDQKRLFQEFSRIKNEQTRDIEGSGLGLSILKKIADLYHGQVSVKSEFGQGSTFTVTLSRGN